MFRKRLSIYDRFYLDEIRDAINQTVNKERDRIILHYKLVDGLTFEEIETIPLPDKRHPEGIYLSARQLQNIVYKYEDRVYGYLAKMNQQ